MEVALTPRASFGSHRHMLQGDAGGTHESSRASHDQHRTAGWRRVSSGQRSEGGGDTAGNDAGEGGGEVWEWNGRRVMIHVSSSEQPPAAESSEGDAETMRRREEGK